MSSDTATWILVAIMSTGVFVWTWSLTKALQLGRAPRETDRWPVDEGPAFETVSGELTIRGEPADLSKHLIHALQQAVPPVMGAFFKVTERTTERIVFEKTGALMCNQPASLYFSEAELNFRPLGNGTVQVSYWIGYERLVRLLRKIALGIILGAGLPVLVIVGTVVWCFVARSDNPIVRWQVFQALQIAHVLWPPFLFMWFYRFGRRQSKAFIENLITSVEVLD